MRLLVFHKLVLFFSPLHERCFQEPQQKALNHLHNLNFFVDQHLLWFYTVLKVFVRDFSFFF